MKITKRQLRKIIKEEKQRLFIERPELAPTKSEHHWPKVDWTNVEELANKWASVEEKAFDKGDPSMMAMGDTVTDAKRNWELQVDQAAMELGAELTARVRKVALQAMKEYTDKLINGDFA
jgi:uncharacterized linocin/CFP29 family protein